ncbi:MAG: hypothetical protein AMJ70_03070 [Dehalococcoidia bacterium SG8_51_3]|nr:MAG: hypothetical protein AMJ70_03070 [Dehalococcoidia bacterium SG8_51_3]
MSDKPIFEQLNSAIIAGDKIGLEKLVGDALKEGITPSDIIEEGMSPSMKEVGERFARYEIYLPEMMMAAEAWEGAMQILEPKLLESGGERKKAGRVVIGLLKMSGFEVFDLGVDVAASAFVTKAEEVGADIIAASALMSTTIPQQKSIIEHLEARGARSKYCVLVGGGSTSQEWADSIGADGYGRTAGDAATLALKAVAQK